MPTIAHYADASYVHEKYHFHSKLRRRKSMSSLGYACVTRSDFTTGRLADRRGEPRSADFPSLLATICHN